MRVEHPNSQQPEKPKATSFKAQLQKASAKPVKPTASVKSQPPAAKPLAAVKAATAKLDQVLARSQKAASTFSKQLVERRTDAELHRPEVKVVAQKLAKLLTRDRDVVDERPRHEREKPRELAQVQPTGAPPPSATNAVQPVQPASRAESLVNQIEHLLERVELLAKAQGPALQLSLTEGRAAHIEVVRTGKNEVALRLEGRSPEDRRALATQCKAIREALAERGLKVRELRVG